MVAVFDRSPDVLLLLHLVLWLLLLWFLLWSFNHLCRKLPPSILLLGLLA